MRNECFRAWRKEVQRTTGRAMSQADMATLAARRAAAAGGGSQGGADGVSEYMQATLLTLEQEFASRDVQGQLVQRTYEQELIRVRAEAMKAQAEAAATRAALAEEVQVCAAEAASAQREAKKAQAEAKAAQAELEAARAGAEHEADGVTAAGVRLRLVVSDAERKAQALKEECEAAKAAHAADLTQWRAEVRTSELRRLAQYEMLQERERAQQDANAAAAAAQQEIVREARVASQAAMAEAASARAQLAESEAEVGELRDQLAFLRSALSSGPVTFSHVT